MLLGKNESTSLTPIGMVKKAAAPRTETAAAGKLKIWLLDL